MNQPAPSMLAAPRRWLLGIALLCAAFAASAQQDPPGRVALLGYQQGSVSFAPAGADSWYDAQTNRPITTGDRLWTDRNARAELFIGSAALRLDGQTHLEFTELDDDTARITSNQGNLQLRVRDELSGQRFEVDTGNIAVVIDAPGEYRIAADPAAGTTWVAVASGRVTLHGENGQSQSLGARQQLTVAGRDLSAVSGAPQQGSGFDAWVAERNRIEDQSISARYVSRDVVGYQQLDAYGDWQSDPTYGDVWFPRNVDADWAPYRDGQWVNVAPWGLTWIDAAPWGFAPSHYGRWARVGPRWGWVPGRPGGRPVYSPALVGFVGGAAGTGGNGGVGWFPLAPGEQWRPGYRASQRYLDQVNRMAIYNRQALRSDFYANQQMPGAVTVVPADRFGRGPFGRRDLMRLPDDRFARGPVAPAPGIAVNAFGGFGRPAAVVPPAAALAARQQQIQLQQARQAQQQQLMQQQQQMEWQRQQGWRQQQDWRRQQDWQAQQEWRQRGEQDRWQRQQQQQLQQQQLQLQQQQAMRQQQEMQQRAAQAQALQQQQLLQQQQAAQMQLLQQQRAAQQQALAQQQQLRQQQEMQQRAAQMQQQAQAQQQALQQAQLRALQQQRGIQPPAVPQPQPGQRGDDPRRLWTSPDSRQ
ncbi:DUF6600 domain-containing protein [Variovorax sp. tm]|uniref:DUF6600 domain-containing protein n=1 Tax=Variovorax atrisoli TaxID=3394203 RepID=UPI003A7FC489